ncbi:MAG: hypothetical protein R6V85_08820 [Polyangia bacterium]
MLSNHLLEQYEEQDEILAAIENGICDSPFCDNPADCFDRTDYDWRGGRVYYRHAR